MSDPKAIKTVSPDLEAEYLPDPHYDTKGRLPIIWHPESRTAYLGDIGWHHWDTYAHHDLDRDYQHYHEGYIGGGPSWGNGKLRWHWGDIDPEDHERILHAVKQLHPDIATPKPDPFADPTPDWQDASESDWI